MKIKKEGKRGGVNERRGKWEENFDSKNVEGEI